MKWYGAAFGASLAPGAMLLYFGPESAGGEIPIVHGLTVTVLTFAVCCVMLAVGCGAPGGRARKYRPRRH